ncbi:MAG: hypothetical protein IJV82_01815 [Oscillospiraceae bacterium]|nr:hypothetical protein [Oscillospiraceae bacterium]
MKNKTYFLNTALAVVVCAAMAAVVLIRSLAPGVVIPKLNIPNMVLLSLMALVIDYYAARGAKRCYVCVGLFSAVTFGLLPLAAGFAPLMDCLVLALVGGIVFTLTTLLYSTIQDRLSSGPAAKAAPILSAIGLLLASQCFAGMIL